MCGTGLPSFDFSSPQDLTTDCAYRNDVCLDPSEPCHFYRGGYDVQTHEYLDWQNAAGDLFNTVQAEFPRCIRFNSTMRDLVADSLSTAMCSFLYDLYGAQAETCGPAGNSGSPLPSNTPTHAPSTSPPSSPVTSHPVTSSPVTSSPTGSPTSVPSSSPITSQPVTPSPVTPSPTKPQTTAPSSPITSQPVTQSPVVALTESPVCNTACVLGQKDHVCTQGQECCSGVCEKKGQQFKCSDYNEPCGGSCPMCGNGDMCCAPASCETGGKRGNRACIS